MSSREKPIEYKGYNILIEQDCDVENPYKDYDQLSDIVGWTRGYDLDSCDQAKEYDSPKAIEEAYKRGELAFYQPLFAYIHGGIIVRMAKGNPYSCQWDSGLAGMVYVTMEKAKEEFPTLSGRTLWLACEKVAKGEVEVFDQYLTGDVWGYWVWKADGSEDKLDGESCWRFYGYDYCLESAKQEVDSLIEAKAKREQQQRDEMWQWEPEMDAQVGDPEFVGWKDKEVWV